MRREILVQLQTEYEQRRQNNDRIFFARRAEVEARCPEIGRLMDGRQQLIFSSIRGILAGTPMADVEKKMADMNEQIRQHLVRNGYAPDYLEPVFTCPICRDTGYVGDPVRELCPCMQKEISRRLYQEIGLQETEEQSYATFDLNVFPSEIDPKLGVSQRQMMDMIRNMTKTWAENWPNVKEEHGVLLSGQSGLGKTFLMHCMLHVLVERGLQVMLLSSFKAQDIMRRAYYSRDGQDDMDLLMNQDVLMIDDFGSEPLLDNITVTQFFNLINERQIHRRACVFSTNLAPYDLVKRYSERISSRLLDRRTMMIVEMRGRDVRRQAAEKKTEEKN